MGFVEFLFETKKGKKIMAFIYGMGASVVIVGALFKIMHWPGWDVMLIAGMGTEAIIFALSAFEPPHMDPDWTLVYPELAGMDEEGGHGHGAHTPAKTGSVTEELDKMLEEAKIEPELLESLGEGLRRLSDNAAKLSDITDAAVATNEYTESLKTASVKVSDLAETYQEASQALTGLSSAAESGASTGEELQKMSQTLEALNRSYEMQLQGSEQQAETMQKMYSGMTELMENLSASVDDTKRYKENISELSKNLQALNTIYGNMLTAMTNTNVNA